MEIKATVSGPMPPKVSQAIGVIAAYCHEGNFVQCIVAREGGVVFRLTDIYDEIFGHDIVREMSAAKHRMEPNTDTATKTVRTRKPSTRKAGASRKTRVGSR
jgi:hypothetical protein